MRTTFERKPLAVMFTDIKGYTNLTSKDEMLALSLVDKKRSILEPLLKKYKGTFVKEMGDGTVTYFKNPSQATDCAIKLQQQAYDHKDLNIRIGIHYGDTIIKNKDVFGHTVNIASRIESLGVPGGVLISKEARDKIKKPHSDISLGLQTMKGVGRLIKVYGLKGKQLSSPDPKDYEKTKIGVHSDNDVPSIAIIPFENKGKEEDVFYAYGISVDLIADVSSSGLIRVASKKQIDSASNLSQYELAKKIDVRYIANGELWRRGDMFQLSVELYDTKDKKVIWSDRWQEDWDNLTSIKGNLSDGLLKALNITSKVENRIETTNLEAYEFYLKAKHKYEKRKNTDDTEIARELLNKSIELDDNLIKAKILIGTTYFEIGEYDKAVNIYRLALKQADKFGNQYESGDILSAIGFIYRQKANYDKALEYYKRALKKYKELKYEKGIAVHFNSIAVINREKGQYDEALEYYKRALRISEKFDDKDLIASILNNIGIVYLDKDNSHLALEYFYKSLKIYKQIRSKRGSGTNLVNIGLVYFEQSDYDKGLNFFIKSLRIYEDINEKSGIGFSLTNIGNTYIIKGEYDKALEYCKRALNMQEKLGDKYGQAFNLNYIGIIYKYKNDYKKAKEYLDKSLFLQKDIGFTEGYFVLYTICNLYTIYKYLRKDYNENKIYELIKKNDFSDFKLNYSLYELLKEESYLKKAYQQVQQKADKLESDVKTKFLAYPISKAIIEEWKKIK